MGVLMDLSDGHPFYPLTALGNGCGDSQVAPEFYRRLEEMVCLLNHPVR